MTRQGTEAAAEIRQRCVLFVAGLLSRSEGAIGADVEFDRLGLDSAMAVAMLFDLEEWLGIELSPSLLFEHTTIAKLAAHLAGESDISQTLAGHKVSAA
jgi:acyl carrier protein